MVSKNNKIKRMEEAAERQSHFGIRKLTIGAASVLLGTTLWMGTHADIAHADTANDQADNADQAQAIDNQVQSISADTQIVAQTDNTNADTEVSQDNSDVKVNSDLKVETPQVSTKDDVTANTKIDEKSTSVSAQNSAQADAAATVKTENAADLNSANNSQNTETNKNAATTQANSKDAKLAENAASDLAKAANAGVADNGDDVKTTVGQAGKSAATDLGDLDLTKAGVAGQLATDTTIGAKQALKLAQHVEANEDNKVIDEKNVKALSASLVEVKKRDAKVTGDNGYQTVDSFEGIQDAINSGAKGVNITGNISGGFWGAPSLNLQNNFTINGLDNATLNMGSSTINMGYNTHLTISNINLISGRAGGAISSNDDNNVITFKNVTSNANSLFNGKGQVHIQGTVTTNVSWDSQTGDLNLQGFGDASKTASGSGQGGATNPGQNSVYSLQATNSYIVNNWKNRKVPNIYASNLFIDDNATLNVNRTETGDGIVLKDGAITNGLNQISISTNNGKLLVGKNATLNINLKNSNMSGLEIKSAKDGIDIHNAAVRVNTSGSFITEENAHITMNVGTGRGVVFSERGANGSVKSSDNYISRGDPGMSGLDDRGNNIMTKWINNNPGIKNTFKLGTNTKFTFVGRDAFMLGNRATFNSGKGSIVDVHTYGNGNAIDMGSFSTLTIDPDSTVSFISDGKKGNGNYNQNNYVALGGGGDIEVLKNATLRVILTGRGSADLNDDINIASYDPDLSPRIYVGNNASLDVQSDAEQGNAELIAIPLPASKSVKFILDNVKYVNLQKTAKTSETILAPGMKSDMVKAFNQRHIPTSKAGYGNLIFMNAGKGENASFEAYGDIAAFKWNNENFNSNGLDFDPNSTVSQNYKKFEYSADQTWSNMYGFNIPYAGFTKANPNGGAIWVDPSGTTAGTNVNSKRGVQFSDIVNGFSPYMSQRLVIIGHSIQPVENQRTVHYVVQDVDKNGNPIETDPSQMREIANPYVQSAQGNNAKSELLYKDNATDQLVQVERNPDGTPKLDANGAVIPIRDASGNYETDGNNVNWNSKNDSISEVDGYYHFNGYKAPKYITGKDSLGQEVVSLDGQHYKLATDAELSSITQNVDQVVKNGDIQNSKNFANTTFEFKSGNFYNTYKDGNLYVIYRVTDPVEQATAKLNFVDDDENNKLLDYTDTTGKPGEGITFSDADSILSALNNKGYVYVDTTGDGITNPSAKLANIKFPDFDNDDGEQVFTVHLKHGITPVNPDHPHDGVDPSEYEKDVKKTVHYEGAGSQTPADNVQTSKWERTITLDKVTGKIIPNGKLDTDWSIASGQPTEYQSVATPEVKGYTPDKKVVPASKVTFDDQYQVVTYKENGTQTTGEKDVTPSQTIHLVDRTTGKELKPSIVSDDNGVKFHYSGDVVDAVTGDKVKTGSWDKTSYTFGWEKVPVVDGYVAVSGYSIVDGVVVAGHLTATVDNPDVATTVYYEKVGNIVPEDPDHNPIPDPSDPSKNIPSVPYKNDPNNPTKVTPDEPVPEIPGYTPNVPTVTPKDPTKDTPVIYTKDVDQKAQLTIIDQDNNNQVIDIPGITTVFSDSGKAGQQITFDGTKISVKELENRGYVYVGTDLNTGSVFDNDENTVQHFTITMKHGTTPINPEKPGKPGEPINPNDPDGPKYPDGTSDTNLTKVVTRTINYVTEDGQVISSPVSQSATFTASGVLDNVTGNWITPLTWTGDQTLSEKNSPTISGYHVVSVSTDADGNNVKAVEVNYDTKSYDVTVTYARDTNPVEKGSVIVTVHDNTTDTDLPQYGYNSGDEAVGTKVDFNKSQTITDLENKGYKVINPDVTIPSEITKGTQTRTIYVEHQIVPVTPENPGKPGEPINPNDPTGPKWPTDSAPSNLTENVTRTVTYQGAGDKTPSTVSDTLTFTAQGYIDKVTGKWVDASGKEIPNGENGLTWTSPDGTSFAGVHTPFINGYHIKSVSDYGTANGDVEKISNINHDSKNINIVVTYEANGKIVPVDPSGKEIPNVPTPQYPTDPENPTTVTPNENVPSVPGYHIVPNQTTPGFDPKTNTVTPVDPGKDTPIKYEKNNPVDNTQHAQVIFRDVNNPADPVQIASSGDLTGDAGSVINYNAQPEISKLEGQGYVLKNDGFPAGAVYDNDKDKMQIFYIDFVHGYKPVNPNNPDNNVDPSLYEKDVKETVHYVGAGDQTPADKVQTSQWSRTLTVDAVTHELVNNGKYDTDWAITKGQKSVYDQVNTPVIQGYHADKRDVPATAVTQDDLEYTVTYTKNGKIVPVDPNHNPIPNAPTPTYPTDPDDPTKVVPNEPVPNIPGYTPEVPTVTPQDPGKNTPVIYNPVAQDQKAQVIYQDVNDPDHPVELATSGILTGKVGSKINYSTTDEIKTLENKGYVLVNNGFPTDAAFDNDDNTTQTFYVTFKHGTVPVTPEKPGKPGEPINPNDPDGPKWPDTTGEDSLKRIGTQTIHYVGAGDQTPEDNKESFTFTKTKLVDKVTGEIIDQGQWNATSHTFGTVNTPFVEGYHADVRTAGGTTVTLNDLNKTVTVTYTKNGKIVPVDPNGKEIPNAPTPTYPTDPNDPTKVVPNEPVPSIPGYTPNVPTVTPKDPGKDTPVIYTPDEVQKGSVIVTVHDNTTNTDLPQYEYNSGEEEVGTKVDYNQDQVVTDLTNKGYVIVDNPTIPTEITEGNHDYRIIVEHGTVPVTPENPGKPGEPINPNDPDGPKWPDTTGKADLTKDVTRTITYVDKDGKELHAPVDQTIKFTAHGVVDKVTGELVTPLTWSPAQQISGQNVPFIKDYHVVNISKDGEGLTEVKGVTLNHTDSSYKVVVTYEANGKIVPVDPEGNPIPNAPTPTYPTDPSDPSKVVPNEPVPSIPGYTPNTPTVTPQDPGKDTPVIYNPVVDKGSVIVTVHDNTTNTDLPQYEYNSGEEEVGTKVDYNKAQTITDLENKGYKVINPDVTIPSEITKGNQKVTIYVEHSIVPVTPENPGHPGEKINPNYDQSPLWPKGTGHNDLIRIGRQIVTYRGADGQTPANNEQTAEFDRTLVIDKVTGKIIKDNGWNADKRQFGTVTTPVVAGYTANKRIVGGKTVTPDHLEEVDEVVYRANGYIIPVDPNGQPIEGAKHLQYRTDLQDPTKVMPNEEVPEVSGFIPTQSSVTPSRADQDTPIVYNPEN